MEKKEVLEGLRRGGLVPVLRAPTADDVAHSVPAGYELRFGARETDPVAALQERSFAPC